ncbi:hypothetical protein [uncultured Duncaniella sp.]|uniref:hypothetical protein n=1 Tax=uncultured Duncaniella sp. TaxID=2768039 RepID=UPI0025B34996|nr:hypothetical protein [uncultured Duncaniella sp.]
MKLFSHNVLATLYFNFKMLPWRQAIHFPFIFYGKVRFIRTSGKILFSNTPKFGIIRIGAQGSEMFPCNTTIMDLAGSFVIEGGPIIIGRGALIRVEERGTLLFNNCRIGANSIVFSEKMIKIDMNAGLSWNCQLMDTDRHDICDIETQVLRTRAKPIIIYKNCWIGNHVIINKGTILPSNTIVASCSLCNQDYSNKILPYSVIGGIPAKLLSINKKRID